MDAGGALPVLQGVSRITTCRGRRYRQYGQQCVAARIAAFQIANQSKGPCGKGPDRMRGPGVGLKFKRRCIPGDIKVWR
jgi:hypothetical protein